MALVTSEGMFRGTTKLSWQAVYDTLLQTLTVTAGKETLAGQAVALTKTAGESAVVTVMLEGGGGQQIDLFAPAVLIATKPLLQKDSRGNDVMTVNCRFKG